jgi:hypothetical protein
MEAKSRDHLGVSTANLKAICAQSKTNAVLTYSKTNNDFQPKSNATSRQPQCGDFRLRA